MTTRYPLVLNGTTIQELQSGDALTGISYNDLADKPTIPTVPTTVSSFTNDAGYLTSFTETDPLFAASAAAGITSTNISNWNTSYGWGNHASAGYLTGINSGQVTTALGYTPIDAGTKGAANGVASLDASGLVPSTQLPSYVDDVLEYANQAAFPATGSTGKIYVALDTNKTYRWSGSAYIEISASPGSTDAVTEGSTNLYFTQARARASVSATQNLTYNSTTGVITGPDLSGYLTSSTASSTYQPLDADLTAIGGLAGTSGLLKKTAANTWTLDTNTYLTGITSGQVTTALGYTPYNSTNPNGYTSNTGTVTSIATSGAITGGTITSTGTITHSTADGYLHVPATGTTNSGKVLTAGATAGSLSWTTPATGTVTSVGMTVPTGLTVSGTPITGSGTLAVTLSSGYAIPTTASQTNWDTAYGWGAHASAGYLTTSTAASTYLALAGGALTGGFREAQVAMGAGNAINCLSGNYFTKSISTATTFTVSNVPASGTAVSFILDLTNGGSATITWWSGVKWASGSAPTLTTSGRDVLGFFTHDGGTTWSGILIAKDVR